MLLPSNVAAILTYIAAESWFSRTLISLASKDLHAITIRLRLDTDLSCRRDVDTSMLVSLAQREFQGATIGSEVLPELTTPLRARST